MHIISISSSGLPTKTAVGLWEVYAVLYGKRLFGCTARWVNEPAGLEQVFIEHQLFNEHTLIWHTLCAEALS